MFRPERRFLFSLLFLVLSLASSVYIAASALNYNQLYPSLDQLQFEITVLHQPAVMPLTPSSLDTTVEFINPSSYNGFAVSQVILDFLYFSNSSATIFGTSSDPSFSYSQLLNIPLQPHSQSTILVSAQMEPKQALELENFTATSNPGSVTGHIRLTVHVSTFFDAITGPIPTELLQNITLT